MTFKNNSHYHFRAETRKQEQHSYHKSLIFGRPGEVNELFHNCEQISFSHQCYITYCFVFLWLASTCDEKVIL